MGASHPGLAGRPSTVPVDQAMRMAFSTVPVEAARGSCYVDDPLMSFDADCATNERNMAKVVGVLAALGYDLAFAKAQRNKDGAEVIWTSARITANDQDESVTTAIKEEILEELTADADRHLSSNHMKIDDVRTFAGRAMCVATLVHAWRPFLWPCCGVRSSTPEATAGRGQATCGRK